METVCEVHPEVQPEGPAGAAPPVVAAGEVPAAALDAGDVVGALVVAHHDVGDGHPWCVCDPSGGVIDAFRGRAAAHEFAAGQEPGRDTWGAWADAPALALLPADEDVRLTLAGALERIAADYRRLDSDLGDLLAMAVGELAAEARLTGARDVATLLDRRAALSR